MPYNGQTVSLRSGLNSPTAVYLDAGHRARQSRRHGKRAARGITASAESEHGDPIVPAAKPIRICQNHDACQYAKMMIMRLHAVRVVEPGDDEGQWNAQ